MQKTISEIANLKGVNRAAVSKFISKYNIESAGTKGKRKTYDCNTEPLKSYLGAIKNKPLDAPESPVNADYKDFGKKPHYGISKPLNDLISGQLEPGQKPATFFYAEALNIAKDNKDATLFFKLGQLAAKEDADEAFRTQALKAEQAKEQILQEKASHLAIINNIKRGFYIDKDTVKTLFGRVYAVHTSVLQSYSLKLSDIIDALPPGEGRRGKIKELIDDETFSALENIKRLLIDFVEEG